jgi:hypothetical protein
MTSAIGLAAAGAAKRSVRMNARIKLGLPFLGFAQCNSFMNALRESNASAPGAKE